MPTASTPGNAPTRAITLWKVCDNFASPASAVDALSSNSTLIDAA